MLKVMATTFCTLSFLSNTFSSPRFNLLRVARHCFSWSSVSDDLFFSSCSFFVSLSVLSLILSLSFLCSSVSEVLFALSLSFLSERVFFVHAKATLAYSKIRVSQVGFNRPDEGRIKNSKRKL